MPISPTSVLYYPSIDIRDENWLRTAALFWDTIRTIVPDGLRNPYSTHFAQSLHGEGVLQPVMVNPDMEEIEALTDDVLDYLTDPASSGILLGAAAGEQVLLHPKKLPREIQEIYEIHPMKLPYVIRNYLNDCLSDRGFAQVDSRFAAFYMTILAKQISERLGLGLVTDSSRADQFATAVRKGRMFRNSDQPGARQHGSYYDASGPRLSLPREVANGALFDLMIENVTLPKDVTAKSLIEFRRAHAEELASLRREVNRLVAEIPEEAPLEALRQAVHDQYENNVRPALRTLKNSLRFYGWDSGLSGLMKISFMSVAPTSALALLHVTTPVALLAGVGISLTATATTQISQRRHALNTSPFSYLLSIEKKW